MSLHISATNAEHPALLLELPWDVPLEEWPDEVLVPLPRGISRHVVRYARAGDEVIAVKELAERPALREYDMLRDLDRLGIPSVDPLAVVTGRTDPDGNPLESVLVTRHLRGSMPYRSMFETTLRPATMHRLMDALAVLLVRLHLAGFAWGDCSLSNTLFRRDAGAYAAYLVDAETGELHPRLSDGQRAYDLDLARVNISGELLDLEASGALHPSVDPVEFGAEIRARYEGLWKELTRTSVYPAGKYHYIERRIRRLNDLGFDVAEMQIEHVGNGDTVTFVPKVVDAGHHQRQLLRLTGLDTEENQARRLLNDLESWMATQDDYAPGDPLGARPEVLAHRWVRDVFRPTVRQVPVELRGSMDPAEIYHQLLEHRWYLSERAQHDIGLDAAVRDYIDNVLPKARAALDPAPETLLEPGAGGGSAEASDAGSPEAGSPDAGAVDAGTSDAGAPGPGPGTPGDAGTSAGK
jgi:tRNA A-37 threonylcarbamoyl transferase component Bud32